MLRYLFFLITLVSIGFAEAAESLVQVPGTSIWIEIPKGFKLSDHFVGVQSESDYIKVIFTELPYSSQENLVRTAARTFESGTVIQSQESIKIGSLTGTRVTAVWDKTKVPQAFEVVMFGDQNESVTISASTPKRLQKHLRRKVDPIINSVQWRKQNQESLYQQLPFTISEGKLLNQMTVSGRSVIFARKTNISLADTFEIAPFFAVGLSFGSSTIEDKKSFAEAKMRENVGDFPLAVRSVAEVDIDGLAGFEIVAEVGNGDRHYILNSIVLFWSGYYVAMLGITLDEAQTSEYMKDFKSISRSFRRKFDSPQ